MTSYTRLENEIMYEYKYIIPKVSALNMANPENTKALAIIEPRDLKILLPVIYNAVYFTRESNFNLYIYCSKNNHDFIKINLNISNYKLLLLDVDNLSAYAYNNLLMSKTFWNTFTEQYILIFQSDVIMLRKFNEKFLNFDYIGPNFYNSNDIVPSYGGIQGGVSLRNREVMLECIDKLSFNDIYQYRKKLGIDKSFIMNEDVFFTYACYMLNKKLPTVVERKEFGIEVKRDFNKDTFAIHGINKLHFNDNQISEIIQAKEKCV